MGARKTSGTKHRRPLGLFAAIAITLSAAAYMSLNILWQLENFQSAKQDKFEWVALQLEVEHLRLEAAVVAARSGHSEDLNELRKRFDVFYSRIPLLVRPATSPLDLERLSRLKDILDAQIPLIDASDTDLLGALDRLQSGLSGIGTTPRDIALSTIAQNAAVEEQERQQVSWLFRLMIATALAASIVLIVTIVRLMGQAAALDKTSQIAEQSRQQLLATLRGSLDAIVVSDARARIVDFNGSAEDIFGISGEDAVGRDLTELLFPPAERKKARYLIAQYRRSGPDGPPDSSRQELEMRHSDGHAFPAEVSISLARSEAGPLYVSYIRDITDKKAQEAEIIRTRDEALGAYKERSRFFAMISHEMRTPLNGVLSALQLLEQSKLDGEQSSFLNAAQTSGDILLAHINDVLAIERSETDLVEEKVPVNMGDLTAGLIGMMEPLARASDTKLVLDQNNLKHPDLMTEPQAVQQILVNLLSNAIKFSPGGEVTLAVGYTEALDASNLGLLQLEVCDTGIGIAPKDLNRIFEDFVSLDSRYERATGGTGLGLGIVRRFVDRLGGEVSCVSELGEGTSFVVHIPMQKASEEATPAKGEKKVQAAPTLPMNILVVDDNDINRDLLSAMLIRMGHQVSLASGGKQAIEIAQKDAFDVVLMDISMPEVNGTQATRTIREGTGPNADTPIVAFTAHALPHERDAFQQAGMNGLLLKPVNRKALEACIAKIQTEADAFDTATAPKPATNPVKNATVLDATQVAELLELLGKDRLQERLSIFGETVKSGAAKLEHAPDMSTLQEQSHALAGACGMMAATKLHALLKDLEMACKSGDAARASDLVSRVPSAVRNALKAWSDALEKTG